MANSIDSTEPVQAPRGMYTLDGRLRGSEAPIEGRCGHVLRLTDPPRYCTRHPRKGRQFCKTHGGNTVQGIAHPNFNPSSDRRRKALNGITRKDYDQAEQDRRLLSLRGIIALFDARLSEAQRKLASGESQTAWYVLRQIVTEAQADHDAHANYPPGADQGRRPLPPDLTALLTRLSALASGALTHDAAWKEIDAVGHSMAKLVDVEMRRRVQARELADRTEVDAMLTAIYLTLHQWFTDHAIPQSSRTDLANQLRRNPLLCPQPTRGGHETRD